GADHVRHPGPAGRGLGSAPKHQAGGHVTEQADRPGLGVGMVGYAFMRAAHSQAWRTAPHVFDLPLRPVMAVLCGRDGAAAAAAARRYGWARAETDLPAPADRGQLA